MNAVLRITAALLALCNWYALTVGSSPTVLAGYGWSELLTALLIPTVLGLAAAEFTLSLARKPLNGSFLDRYAAMAATVWIGGCFAAWCWSGAASTTRRWASPVRSASVPSPACGGSSEAGYWASSKG